MPLFRRQRSSTSRRRSRGEIEPDQARSKLAASWRALKRSRSSRPETTPPVRGERRPSVRWPNPLRRSSPAATLRAAGSAVDYPERTLPLFEAHARATPTLVMPLAASACAAVRSGGEPLSGAYPGPDVACGEFGRSLSLRRGADGGHASGHEVSESGLRSPSSRASFGAVVRARSGVARLAVSRHVPASIAARTSLTARGSRSVPWCTRRVDQVITTMRVYVLELPPVFITSMM